MKTTSRMYCGRFEFTTSQIIDGDLLCGVGDTAEDSANEFKRCLADGRKRIDGIAYFRRAAYRNDYLDHNIAA